MNPRPKYDDLPASGAWPGGPRYGYKRTRVFITRPWDAVHVTLAEQLGIKLPFVDYQYREIWWDAPMDTWVEGPSPRPAVDWFTKDTYATEVITPKLWVRHANKYARVSWEKLDPLAHIIKTVQQFITEER